MDYSPIVHECYQNSNYMHIDDNSYKKINNQDDIRQETTILPELSILPELPIRPEIKSGLSGDNQDVKINVKINFEQQMPINIDHKYQLQNKQISYTLLLVWSSINSLLYYYTNIEIHYIDEFIHILLKWYIFINIYNMVAYTLIHANNTSILCINTIYNIYIVLSIISNLILIGIYFIYLGQNIDPFNTYIYTLLILNVYIYIYMLK